MLNFDRLQRHLTNPLTLTPNARAGGSGMPAYSRKDKKGLCVWMEVSRVRTTLRTTGNHKLAKPD